MSKFFSLNVEKFELKWLFKYGFWKIIYFSILAKFGVITVYKSPTDDLYISYGTETPLQDLWNKGFRVSLIGWVFYEPILLYSHWNIHTKAPYPIVQR